MAVPVNRALHTVAITPHENRFAVHSGPADRRLTNVGASNGLLRQFFSKGTNLAVHTAEVLIAVEERMNNRPRRTLGWRTPAQVFTELVPR